MLKFVDFVAGRGSNEVCEFLFAKLSGYTMNMICTDGNYAYDKCIPKSIEHIITKSETCLVESFNSVLNYGLARLQRRTKCY